MNAVERRRKEAGLLGHMRRRIIETILEAEPGVLKEGAEWYKVAHDLVAKLYPENVSVAAGVVAALSPRCRWEENLRRAEELMASFLRQDAQPPSIHISLLTNQAWKIVHGANPLDVLHGPKVRAFYRNLLLDEEPVTVDVWAARVAEGRVNPNAPKGRRYNLIARAYREAADRLSLSPSTCQATAWVQVRDYVWA